MGFNLWPQTYMMAQHSRGMDFPDAAGDIFLLRPLQPKCSPYRTAQHRHQICPVQTGTNETWCSWDQPSATVSELATPMCGVSQSNVVLL